MLSGINTLRAPLESRPADRPRLADPSEGVGVSPSIANQPAKVDFSDVLAESINEVRAAFRDADHAATEAMLGRGTPHNAMIAMTEADLTFRFITQARNKLVDAYREVMNLRL